MSSRRVIMPYNNLKTSKLDIKSLRKMKAKLRKPMTSVDHDFIDKVEKSLLKQRFPSAYKILYPIS